MPAPRRGNLDIERTCEVTIRGMPRKYKAMFLMDEHKWIIYDARFPSIQEKRVTLTQAMKAFRQSLHRMEV